MCPATKKYIDEIYIDKNSNLHVATDNITEQNVISRAKRVLALNNQNKNPNYLIIFPDVKSIYSALLTELAPQPLSVANPEDDEHERQSYRLPQNNRENAEKGLTKPEE
jgi:hypothetical protein